MKVSNRNFYLICLLSVLFTFVCGDAYAGDVFDAIKGKAWAVVSGVRRIAMLIAAFGLIGFAFGAIFGKISWKWFANIAIGLFLVANVGLFIDYFATRSGKRGQYAALGYGDYISNSSSGGSGGGYSQTPGASDKPSSQTPGTNGGSSGQSNSGQLSGSDCQPGTGVGCGGSGSGGSSSTTGNSSGASGSSNSGNSSASNSASKNGSSSTNSSAKNSSSASSSSSANKSSSSSSKKTGPSYVDAGLKGTEKMEGVGLSKVDTGVSGEVPSLNVGDIMNNINGSGNNK